MIYQGNKQNCISFPIGGIGTGSIGLAGNGRLMDWEIFNRPSKGSINGYSHFAVRAKMPDGQVITKILNGDIRGDYMGQYEKKTVHGYGFGPACETMCGYPHFSECSFKGEFPVAELTFEDKDFPAKVILRAFNPMIPHDADNSSLPAAFFEVEFCNTSEEKIEFCAAFSVANPFSPGYNCAFANGVTLYSTEDKESLSYGDLTVLSLGERVEVQPYWYRGGWQDAPVTFWNEFSSGKPLKNRLYDTEGKKDACSVTNTFCLSSGDTDKARFLLSWNVPNCYKYWGSKEPLEEKLKKRWKNYYATVFADSKATAEYCVEHWDSLQERTLKFKDTLYSTTLDARILDRAIANLAVLKSPTVLRLQDGSFWAWEGVHEESGSCEGTCQHVWNYAYAMCFLFPELERSIRDLELRYSTSPEGKMDFRFMLPLGAPRRDSHACVDGQMGTLIKIYRDWKITGNGDWIKENWQIIKKIIAFAWSADNSHAWDRDKDGVLEGRQHHTLDMELFGPSSWLEGFYLGALKAGAEMAEFVGDANAKAEYTALFEKGYAWTKEHLFNGSYFIQKVDLTDKSILDRFGCADTYWNEESGQIKYQIDEGSSIDQLSAQWHADLCGLGDLFDREQVTVALKNLYQNNFKVGMRNFTNPWRIFSLNDESGAVICDYPEGVKKPDIPVPYCEETMTGFEYQMAGLLISRGYVEEGKKLVYALHERFDGERRNPWNEFECGSNYSRSMSSYALLLALSGFRFDMSRGYLGFDPKDPLDDRR
ncbi:MAG: hypothetical protein IJX19_06795, partial [Clostridia bacterium]|nr:hypothetical protein [Clostridia bacterium]